MICPRSFLSSLVFCARFLPSVGHHQFFTSSFSHSRLVCCSLGASQTVYGPSSSSDSPSLESAAQALVQLIETKSADTLLVFHPAIDRLPPEIIGDFFATDEDVTTLLGALEREIRDYIEDPEIEVVSVPVSVGVGVDDDIDHGFSSSSSWLFAGPALEFEEVKSRHPEMLVYDLEEEYGEQHQQYFAVDDGDNHDHDEGDKNSETAKQRLVWRKKVRAIGSDSIRSVDVDLVADFLLMNKEEDEILLSSESESTTTASSSLSKNTNKKKTIILCDCEASSSFSLMIDDGNDDELPLLLDTDIIASVVALRLNADILFYATNIETAILGGVGYDQTEESSSRKLHSTSSSLLWDYLEDGEFPNAEGDLRSKLEGSVVFVDGSAKPNARAVVSTLVDYGDVTKGTYVVKKELW